MKNIIPVGAIVFFMVIVFALLKKGVEKSKLTTMQVLKVKTVIKIIDLPEEIDCISTDPRNPSIMQVYRSQDTMKLGFHH